MIKANYLMKINKLILAITVTLFGFQIGNAQKESVKVTAIGFYNLENLFDTEDDPVIWDEEFTPDGSKAWTKDKYAEKLTNMAYVISQIGTELTPNGVSILGISEIENRKVVEDLLKEPTLAGRGYEIIHYDSPDFRGIDVGLIYNPKHFKVTKSTPIAVDISVGDNKRTTRDILHVEGLFDGEPLHIMVNHWPSRRGGEKKSAWKRNKAAKMCRTVIDSLEIIDPGVKVIVMGDLNDDPTSESVQSHLRAVSKKSDLRKNRFLFNPYEDIYRRGLGSNAYRDAWSLFDQLIITESLAKENNQGYYFHKGQVFNKKFLIQRSGQYKGYPFRTFSFDKYQGGYSDHFPSFIYLIKKV